MRFSLKRGSDLARAAKDIVLDDEAGDPPADPPAGEDPPEETAPADPPPADPPEQPAPGAAASAAATIRAEERQRVADVFASDDVKGREQAAVLLLTETDMSAEKIIAKLPSLTPAGADAMLANLRQPNPSLGAGADSEGGGKASARILAAQRGLSGKRPDKD
jgi:hypothetical protein